MVYRFLAVKEEAKYIFFVVKYIYYTFIKLSIDNWRVYQFFSEGCPRRLVVPLIWDACGGALYSFAMHCCKLPVLKGCTTHECRIGAMCVRCMSCYKCFLNEKAFVLQHLMKKDSLLVMVSRF